MKECTLKSEHRFQAIRKTAVVGALVNLILGALKILVGIAGQSQSLVADGIHSLSDLLSDGLVYFVSRHACHAPDSEHPYGHGRFETMATMVLGGFLVLLALGIVWDAIMRLLEPGKLLEPNTIALYAAGLSVLANEGLFYYTLRVGRQVKSSLVLANAWHHRSDAISSIIVLVGIGGTLAGWPYLDAVAAIGVGVMIAKIGWDLGGGAAQELVDVGLPDERVMVIRKTIMSVSGVEDLHMLRTRSLGNWASVDVHVLVDARLSVSEGHMISLMVEEGLKEQIEEIEDVTVHIDPEDDESAIRSYGLPQRSDALVMLNQCWQDIAQARLSERITLHYLDGEIDVEVYFGREKIKNSKEMNHLELVLQNALIKEKLFGKVRVFVG